MTSLAVGDPQRAVLAGCCMAASMGWPAGGPTSLPLG